MQQKRISIMGMINKLAWPVSPLFIALFASNSGGVGLEDLDKPFLVIICLFVILGVVALISPLPEVKAAGEDDADADSAVSDYANSKHSVFQFPHLVLGAIAIFFYVGSETIVLGTLIDYASELRSSSSSYVLMDYPNQHQYRIYRRYYSYS